VLAGVVARRGRNGAAGSEAVQRESLSLSNIMQLDGAANAVGQVTNQPTESLRAAGVG